MLASNTAGKEILFWDVARKQPLDLPAWLEHLNGPDAHAEACHQSGFQSRRQTSWRQAMKMRRFSLWDATTGARIGTEPVCEFDNPTYSPVHALAYSSTGQLGGGGRDPKILLCDATGSPSKPDGKET